MAKCIYCNQETSEPLIVRASEKKTAEEYVCCGENCRQKASAFLRFMRHTLPVFFLLLLCSLGLIFFRMLDFSWEDRFLAAGMVLLGIDILVFPFSSGYGFEEMGIRKARRNAYILGSVVLLVGILVFFFA